MPATEAQTPMQKSVASWREQSEGNNSCGKNDERGKLCWLGKVLNLKSSCHCCFPGELCRFMKMLPGSWQHSPHSICDSYTEESRYTRWLSEERKSRASEPVSEYQAATKGLSRGPRLPVFRISVWFTHILPTAPVLCIPPPPLHHTKGFIPYIKDNLRYEN